MFTKFIVFFKRFYNDKLFCHIILLITAISLLLLGSFVFIDSLYTSFRGVVKNPTDSSLVTNEEKRITQYYGDLLNSDVFNFNYEDEDDNNEERCLFKERLKELTVESHTNVLTYSELWSAFFLTDSIEIQDDMENGETYGIFDIYSKKNWTYHEEQCGEYKQYKKEMDCYNREHSFPKSWWSGSTSIPAYTDLHHIFPTDGYVNGRRGNLPYGEVEEDTIRYESSAGCRIGKCKFNNSYDCFEPVNDVKGDLARAYFYISLRYDNVFTCCKEPGTYNNTILDWLELTLRKWHEEDQVDSREKRRNHLIDVKYQNNRNPFVDFPNFVDIINDF